MGHVHRLDQVALRGEYMASPRMGARDRLTAIADERHRYGRRRGYQERTAPRCIPLLDGGIDETSHLDPTRQLEHHVEADACDQRAGRKGCPTKSHVVTAHRDHAACSYAVAP